MPYDERNDSGKFRAKYSPEDALNIVRERDGGATTAEVADALGCSPRLALKLLRDLEGNGRVNTRDVGNTFLWRENDE